jgi:hypothetical protein
MFWLNVTIVGFIYWSSTIEEMKKKGANKVIEPE